MIKEEDLIRIGNFQKTHALKGELNMITEIDSEFFDQGKPLVIDYDGIPVPYYVESIRKKGSTSFLVKLSGVDTEEEASQFVNKEISVMRQDAEEWLGEEILGSEDIKGFSIEDAETGKKIGIIEELDDSTANILFVVRNDSGEEIYIPANEEFIEEIDEENKKIKVNLPEGLLDLNSKPIE